MHILTQISLFCGFIVAGQGQGPYSAPYPPFGMSSGRRGFRGRFDSRGSSLDYDPVGGSSSRFGGDQRLGPRGGDIGVFDGHSRGHDSRRESRGHRDRDTHSSSRDLRIDNSLHPDTRSSSRRRERPQRGSPRSRSRSRGESREGDRPRLEMIGGELGFYGAAGGYHGYPYMGGVGAGDNFQDGGARLGIGYGIGTGSYQAFMERRRRGGRDITLGPQGPSYPQEALTESRLAREAAARSSPSIETDDRMSRGPAGFPDPSGSRGFGGMRGGPGGMGPGFGGIGPGFGGMGPGFGGMGPGYRMGPGYGRPYFG